MGLRRGAPHQLLLVAKLPNDEVGESPSIPAVKLEPSGLPDRRHEPAHHRPG